MTMARTWSLVMIFGSVLLWPSYVTSEFKQNSDEPVAYRLLIRTLLQSNYPLMQIRGGGIVPSVPDVDEAGPLQEIAYNNIDMGPPMRNKREYGVVFEGPDTDLTGALSASSAGEAEDMARKNDHILLLPRSIQQIKEFISMLSAPGRSQHQFGYPSATQHGSISSSDASVSGPSMITGSSQDTDSKSGPSPQQVSSATVDGKTVKVGLQGPGSVMASVDSHGRDQQKLMQNKPSPEKTHFFSDSGNTGPGVKDSVHLFNPSSEEDDSEEVDFGSESEESESEESESESEESESEESESESEESESEESESEESESEESESDKRGYHHFEQTKDPWNMQYLADGDEDDESKYNPFYL